jgi:hypothetical protein
MRSRTAVLAATLAMAPLGAWGADLVVCWQKEFYAQRDEALSETKRWTRSWSGSAGGGSTGSWMPIVAGFEQGIGEGRDDSNSKTFFDYKAAAQLKEAQNALDRLTITRSLRERGYAPKEIKLIQQATLHGFSGGKRARERAKQAQAQLDTLSQSCVAENA